MNLAFQRKTDLAVRAMQSFSGNGDRISGSDLADRIGTTKAFLAQVLAPLIEEGWISSDRGPGGGYSLTPVAAEASLFDVMEATQGPIFDGRCVLRDQPCPGNEACEAHNVWSDARDFLIDGFKEISAITGKGEGEGK